LSSILLLFVFVPGDVYFAGRNYDEAYRYYRVMKATAPSFENNYGAAVCALLQGRLEESVELFEATPDKTGEVFYYLGIAYYQLHRYDKAEFCFTQACKKGMRIWQCDYYLGLIKLKENNVVEAMGYFDLLPDSSDKKILVDYMGDYNRLAAAREKYKEGAYRDALKLYEDMKYFQGFKEVGRAFALAGLKEYKKSRELLDSIITSTDDRILLMSGLFRAAEVSLDLKDRTKARFYLKRYLSMEEDPRICFLLGRSFSEEARYDSASVYFKGLPDSVDEYLFYKGRTDYFLGLWGRAEESLLRHRELFPHSIYADRTVFILASINYKREEYDYAIDFWTELVDLHPNSIYAAAAQKGIGSAYFNIKQYKKALAAFRRVDEYNPSPGIKEETRLKIYETLYRLKKFPSLIEALRKFVEENPDSRLAVKTRMRIAKILFNRKEYYQSLSELNKIIEKYPDSDVTIEALIEKARIYQIFGKKRALKEVFQELLRNKKTAEYYSYAANELAILYSEEMKYDSSLYYYNTLLNDEKYKEKALLEIARIYDVLGQFKEAETMLDRLISEFPSSVFTMDAYFLKTRVYRTKGSYKAAIELLNELLQKVGERPEIYLEMGHIYFEIENYLNARENYLLACEHFKQRRDDAAQALIFAGDASLAIGDTKSAREEYLRANLIAESLALKNQATAKLTAIGGE